LIIHNFIENLLIPSRISVVVGGGSGTNGAAQDDNKNRKPLAVLRLSSVDTPVDDVEMNADGASKRDDQVNRN